MNRFEQLLAGYLEQSLTAAETQELAHFIDDNQELRDLFVDVVAQDRALRVEFDRRSDLELAQQLVAALKRDERDFVRGIMSDLKQTGPSRQSQVSGFLGRFHAQCAGLLIWARRRPVAASAVFLFAAVAAGYAVQSLRQVEPPAGVVMVESEAGFELIQRAPSTRPPGGEAILQPGDRVQTGDRQTAQLRFTEHEALIEIGTNSVVELLRLNRGKQLALRSGRIQAAISRQPEGRPLRVLTAHGEYTVRGTEFTLETTASQTRLDVTKGVVVFRQTGARRSVDVTTGHYLVSNGRTPATAEPAGLITINFGPEGMVLPSGVVNDSGQRYDPRRSYGWDGPQDNGHLPGEYWLEPDGNLTLAHAGRAAGSRSARGDVLYDTLVTTGWRKHSQTWRFRLANGPYEIAIAVGDSENEQGPHHVAIEGHQIVDSLLTAKGEFAIREAAVEVTDGELTLIVGGYDGPQVTQDGSFDTTINFLRIRKLRLPSDQNQTRTP